MRCLVIADKTKNIYELEKPHYEKLLTGNITKKYKQYITTFITVLIWTQNILHKNLKQQTELNVWPEIQPI